MMNAIKYICEKKATVEDDMKNKLIRLEQEKFKQDLPAYVKKPDVLKEI